MATKNFVRSHFNLILICLTAIVTTILYTACNNSNDQGRIKPTNWVTLKIKFKPNTNEQRRDSSIKEIQRMLLDSVAPLRHQYSNYNPSLEIITTPFTDTLHCWISVINTYGLADPTSLQYSKDTTPDPPVCPACPLGQYCRVCGPIGSYSTNPDYGIDSIYIVVTR